MSAEADQPLLSVAGLDAGYDGIPVVRGLEFARQRG